MKKHIITAIVIALVVALVIPTSCAKPAEFEVTTLNISPAEVVSGEPTDVTVEVENIGGSEGTYIATIRIDGVEVETEEVTVAAGAKEKVLFTVTKDTPGTYHIELDGLSDTLRVWARCQFQIPPGQTVDCDYLTVPEDRSQPDGPTIQLHFAIFRSYSDTPAPDPIVYLAGGPGEHALEAASLTFNQRFASFLADRDFIIFDQRGVGYSEPALDCQELIDLAYETLAQDLSPEEGVALGAEAVCSCRDRLVSEGVNLAAYSSAESAADLNDLRLALGYEEWNLYGISYGTKLALTTMRDYSEGIRSVILDSTYPLQVSINTETPANFDRALDVFFGGCAADPACSDAYPELETVFWELVEQLNASPVTFSVTQPLSGETYDVLINGDGLIGFLFKSLYSTELIPHLPRIIYDARDGNYDTLALVMGSFLVDIEFVSHGMNYSVQCGEEVHFSTSEELTAACDAYPELQSFFYGTCHPDEGICAICEVWGTKEADPIENEPVASGIPTLVLAGEYDPVTPPSWGEMVTDNLSGSFLLEFPGVGHGASVSGEECPLSIALAFLDDPTTQPDGSCVAVMSGPAFFVPETEITLVPFTDKLFGISGVVPEGWDELYPSVYTRSALGLVSILQQVAPGIGADALLQLLTASFGLDEVPESVGSRQANDINWSLYEFELQDLSIDLAVAESDGTSCFILLQSTASERDFHYEEVYLPAIDALTPIGG
ncbi:MAG TPA: alpha/beta fold hydrolase [Dehalococcoidia bacterium]|nr:alpha/beta fold hydrolase [Dehalococcoidia bacterium]